MQEEIEDAADAGVLDDDDAPAVALIGRHRAARRRDDEAADANGAAAAIGGQQEAGRRRRGPRNDDKIKPARLRYLFWDSECAMREDAAIPPPANPQHDDDIAAEEANDFGQDEAAEIGGVGINHAAAAAAGARLYHEPLLVMAELLCVPCMDAGYG
jgi:hypothetical protein